MQHLGGSSESEVSSILSSLLFGFTSIKVAAIDRVQSIMHDNIGKGCSVSATIGAAIVAQRPATFTPPITNPKKAEGKNSMAQK